MSYAIAKRIIVPHSGSYDVALPDELAVTEEPTATAEPAATTEFATCSTYEHEDLSISRV